MPARSHDGENGRNEKKKTKPILTTTDRVRVLGRRRTDQATRARQLEVARLVARAVNTSDSAPVIARLAPDVVRTSQSISDDIVGFEAVADSLRAAFDRDRDGDPLHPVAEVGIMRADGVDDVGVIVTQGGLRRVFWSFGFDEAGRISRFDGFTVLPHPDGAEATGERPGHDAERFARSQAVARRRQREHVQSLQGPLEFIVFVWFEEDREPLMQLYRERLSARYPGSLVRVVLATPEEDGLPSEPGGFALACEARVLGLPAVGVRCAGEWIRHATGSAAVDAVISDLKEVGLMPLDHEGEVLRG